MTIRVFKLISGELIIGKQVKNVAASLNLEVSTSPDADVFEGPLRSQFQFSISTPMILHFTPQGMGLAPLIPWCGPDKDATMEFYGKTVMGEIHNLDNPIHAPIVREYTQITSRIVMPSSGNVSPLRPC